MAFLQNGATAGSCLLVNLIMSTNMMPRNLSKMNSFFYGQRRLVFSDKDATVQFTLYCYPFVKTFLLKLPLITNVILQMFSVVTLTTFMPPIGVHALI